MMTKPIPLVTTISAVSASLRFPDLEFFKIEDNRKPPRFALAIKNHQVVVFAPELSLTQCVKWSETYYERAVYLASENGRLYGIQREMMLAANAEQRGKFMAGAVL
jgi:hypothetical protein